MSEQFVRLVFPNGKSEVTVYAHDAERHLKLGYTIKVDDTEAKEKAAAKAKAEAQAAALEKKKEAKKSDSKE